MDLILTPTEARILGCMIEKEQATPNYYPMTLNALIAACNQKNNRDPVLSFDEKTVEQALSELRYQKQLVGQVTVTGSRVSKYKHNLLGKYTFSREQLAILCELFLRGPQTVGELRTHASRMCPLPDLATVESVLEGLTQMEGGAMVVKLSREPGRREQRWAHLLCGPVDVAAASAPESAAEPAAPADSARMSLIEQDLAAVKRDLGTLKGQLEELRKLVQPEPAGGESAAGSSPAPASPSVQ
jgi:hypothetical protein